MTRRADGGYVTVLVLMMAGLLAALTLSLGSVVRPELGLARLGGEAVQLSNQHEYHLVIADSTLVVENGIAVLDGVLASRPDWRPRLVSVGQRIGGCPASIHLDKPLDVKLLRAAIDEVLSTPPPSPASTARP